MSNGNYSNRFKPTIKPTILIFSSPGFEGDLNKISAQANVYQASFQRPDDASKLLRAHTRARAILIVDPEITTAKLAALSGQVYEYVCQGGIVILGGLFSSIVNPDAFDTWMRNQWELPWRSGQYETTKVCLQKYARGLGSRGDALKHGLSRAYSSKATFLRDVESKDVSYAAPPGARSENIVCHGKPVAAETSVAFAKVGKGRLGYVGDVNVGEPITRIELAMRGLLPSDI